MNKTTDTCRLETLFFGTVELWNLTSVFLRHQAILYNVPFQSTSKAHPQQILGFHVTSPNSRIQNWEAYKIFPSFKERLPKNMSVHNFLARCRAVPFENRTVSISEFPSCVT